MHVYRHHLHGGSGSGIVHAVDEVLIGSHIFDQAHLGALVQIVAVFVSVEMIGGDVGEYADVEAGAVGIVELEATHLQHKIIVLASGYLPCKLCPTLPPKPTRKPASFRI